jgi:hypothetical protein
MRFHHAANSATDTPDTNDTAHTNDTPNTHSTTNIYDYDAADTSDNTTKMVR